MIRIVGRLFVIRVAGATTAVRAEVAVAEPFSFVAVTLTRRRKPRSARRTPLVLPVAPTTSEQFVPSTSQRCHWKANESGLPLQLPGFAVSSWPTRAMPAIVGGDV